jgi:hypothetical protein
MGNWIRPLRVALPYRVPRLDNIPIPHCVLPGAVPASTADGEALRQDAPQRVRETREL